MRIEQICAASHERRMSAGRTVAASKAHIAASQVAHWHRGEWR
jgi:hypothetical protein